MPENSTFNNNLIRVLAILCLLLSLREASVFLGLGSNQASPISNLGVLSFFLMLTFTVFRLFAAVGMWVKTTWGTVLVLVVTSIEFSILTLTSIDIYISTVGIWIRATLLLGIIIYFILTYMYQRKYVYD